jgi:transketolase
MRHEVLSGRPTPLGATASADGTNFAARVAMEQASTLGWDRYVGDDGAVVGMHTFGASAPLKQLLVKFGFTPDQVAQVARDRVAAVGQG